MTLNRAGRLFPRQAGRLQCAGTRPDGRCLHYPGTDADRGTLLFFPELTVLG